MRFWVNDALMRKKHWEMFEVIAKSTIDLNITT